MFDERVVYTEKYSEDLKGEYVARVTDLGNVVLERIESDGYAIELNYYTNVYKTKKEETSLIIKLLNEVPMNKTLYLSEGFPFPR